SAPSVVQPQLPLMYGVATSSNVTMLGASGPNVPSSRQILTEVGSICDTSRPVQPRMPIETCPPPPPRLTGFGHDVGLMSSAHSWRMRWMVWLQETLFPHESVTVHVRRMSTWNRSA